MVTLQIIVFLVFMFYVYKWLKKIERKRRGKFIRVDYRIIRDNHGTYDGFGICTHNSNKKYGVEYRKIYEKKASKWDMCTKYESDSHVFIGGDIITTDYVDAWFESEIMATIFMDDRNKEQTIKEYGKREPNISVIKQTQEENK